MKKILALIASPRKLGNCEILAKEISRHIKVEHELEIIRISDYNLEYCKGCYQCLFKEKECSIDDDLGIILQAMALSDAYIIVAPTYFLGANAALKTLLDRGLSFYSMADKLWQKPAAGIAIAGIEGKEGSTLLSVQSFMKIFLADIKYSAVMYAAFPGEIFLNKKNRDTAKKIADSLFGEAAPKPEICCPLCGGDTFRFLGGNKVKCMLCSNEGVMNSEIGKISFEMQKSAHELFLTFDKAMEHMEWLKDMKRRFFDKIRDIKVERDKYK